MKALLLLVAMGCTSESVGENVEAVKAPHYAVVYPNPAPTCTAPARLRGSVFVGSVDGFWQAYCPPRTNCDSAQFYGGYGPNCLGGCADYLNTTQSDRPLYCVIKTGDIATGDPSYYGLCEFRDDGCGEYFELVLLVLTP